MSRVRLWSRSITASTLMLGLMVPCWMSSAAWALVTMDDATINHAIRYGAIKGGKGFEELLGPNWKTGPNGMLLNIYTPYMQLAAQAYKMRLPRELDAKQMKAVKQRLRRDIRFLKDENERQYVKFAVSLYGDRPDFAPEWNAHIVGVGRGREYTLEPFKRSRPGKVARSPYAASDAQPYEAINAYYFALKEITKLDGDYRFVLTHTPTGQTVPFKLNNEEIY